MVLGPTPTAHHAQVWNRESPFHASEYWAGIDCGGFIQRIVHAGRLGLPNDVNIEYPEITTGGGGAILASTFSDAKYIYKYVNMENDKNKILKRGDLVGSNHHVAAVYYKTPESEDKYFQIIQAFGGQGSTRGNGWEYFYPPNGSGINSAWIDKVIFGRKVLVSYTVWGFGPTYYGKIKFWDK